MKPFLKSTISIIVWLFVQILIIALLYGMGAVPSAVIMNRLGWGGLSGVEWALNYELLFVPLCYVICLIYTIAGVVVTNRIPMHSKRWWIITAICYVAFLIITGAGLYLATGYAFYDACGAAIIDVWLAPLLWLGEIELFLWIVKKWKGMASVIALIAFVLIVLPSCRHPKPVSDSIHTCNREELYYETMTDSVDVDWSEIIPVFHYWRDIPAEDYLFGAPSEAQIAAWKALCEKENPADSVVRREVQAYCLNMNQYMTIHDFMNIWWQQNPYGGDDAFTLWRLAQYDTEARHPNTVYEKMHILESLIDSLCIYEPLLQYKVNFWAGMIATLQELYDRILLREAIRYSGPSVGNALKREQQVWEAYHAQLVSNFIILDGDPNVPAGSAASMGISGIRADNAGMRAKSLGDFLFTITGTGPGVNERERHSFVSEERVLQEYKLFMGAFVEDEYRYSVQERKDVLMAEMVTWKKWMRSRSAVSSLLSGSAKEAYDNSTNNVRRRKMIMLMNRYRGYGMTSNDVLSSLIPYDVSDEELNGPSLGD